MLCISCFCSIFRQTSSFGTLHSRPKQCKHVLDFSCNPSWNLLEICSVIFVDALIIHLFDSVINLLSTESYVIVISLDFSKTFDTYNTQNYYKNASTWHLGPYLQVADWFLQQPFSLHCIRRRTVYAARRHRQHQPGTSHCTLSLLETSSRKYADDHHPC